MFANLIPAAFLFILICTLQTYKADNLLTGALLPNVSYGPEVSTERNAELTTQVKLPQDSPVIHNLLVSLEEIDQGVTKKMRVTRRVVRPDGSAWLEEITVEVVVEPGCATGTRKIFSRVGDQSPERIPADVVFFIRERPHSKFKRDHSDIKYTAKISLKQALCGLTIDVPTLQGDTISYNETFTIKPSSVKRFRGRGLPNPKIPDRRGDYIINYDIKFPNHLSDSVKESLMELLPDK